MNGRLPFEINLHLRLNVPLPILPLEQENIIISSEGGGVSTLLSSVAISIEIVYSVSFGISLHLRLSTFIDFSYGIR